MALVSVHTRRARARREAQRQSALNALNAIACALVPALAVLAIAAAFVLPALAKLAAALPAAL